MSRDVHWFPDVKTISYEEIEEIVRRHELWLSHHPHGKFGCFDKIDLMGFDLFGRNIAAVSFGGCFGLQGYVGTDSRGYSFHGIFAADGPRVIAGCRNYTAARAIAHWGPGGKSNRPDCLDLAKKAIALAERSKEERP
jgi:hypothetical protein